MVARFLTGFAALSVVVLLAGCSAGSGGSDSAGKPLQLRVALSSTKGSCSAPELKSTAPAVACARDGDTTYRLARSLGTITPTSVELSDEQGAATSVTLRFDDADTDTLADASRKALDKHLAIVLDGRVLTAPQVMEPMTSSDVSLAFAKEAEAEQVAVELRATNSD